MFCKLGLLDKTVAMSGAASLPMWLLAMSNATSVQILSRDLAILMLVNYCYPNTSE